MSKSHCTKLNLFVFIFSKCSDLFQSFRAKEPGQAAGPWSVQASGALHAVDAVLFVCFLGMAN